jgi:hypothetical protein
VAIALSRGLLLVVAVVAAAWLALSYRGVVLEADGEALIERAQKGNIPDAELRHAQLELNDARRLRANTDPLLIQGRLELAAGRTAVAARTARQLTETEPENVDGWYLAYAAESDDPGYRRDVLTHIYRLNPWLGEELAGAR